MVALAGLLMVAACGVCLRSMMKGSRQDLAEMHTASTNAVMRFNIAQNLTFASRHSHSKKATKRKVTLQAEAMSSNIASCHWPQCFPVVTTAVLHHVCSGSSSCM